MSLNVFQDQTAAKFANIQNWSISAIITNSFYSNQTLYLRCFHWIDVAANFWMNKGNKECHKINYSFFGTMLEMWV